MDKKGDRLKVIVTGANGFVGRAVCEALAEQGAEVVRLVRADGGEDRGTVLLSPEVRRQQEPSPLSSFAVCEMASYKHLPRIPECAGADVCYHFAWEGSAGDARKDPEIQLRNIRYTCDLVKACADIGCRRFIYAGSIMEYEVRAMINGNTAPPENALYSAAKMSANDMAQILANAYGIDYIRTIISNIYGPGEKSARLINTSLRKMLAGEVCAFSPGEQLYDFVYIDDAANMFAALLTKGHANRAYYIGSGKVRKLKEFLEEMREIAAPDVPSGLGKLPAPGFSPQYNEFDLHALPEDTGVTAQVAFSEGIRRTISWIRENPQ